MYRDDLKQLEGLDSYYRDDSDDEEQDIDCDDFEDDIDPDWQRALNDYEHSFEKY